MNFQKRELVVQTINSNKIRVNESGGENELLELTKIIIQKQNQLNSFLKIGLKRTLWDVSFSAWIKRNQILSMGTTSAAREDDESEISSD